jgi:hypothetical protein
MDEKIAGADEFAVFGKVLIDKTARAVAESIAGLVGLQTVQQGVDPLRVRVDLEFVLLGEGPNDLQTLFAAKGGRVLGPGVHHSPGFGRRDLNVGVEDGAGGAEFGRLEPEVDIVADETSPVFFHEAPSFIFVDSFYVRPSAPVNYISRDYRFFERGGPGLRPAVRFRSF